MAKSPERVAMLKIKGIVNNYCTFQANSVYISVLDLYHIVIFEIVEIQEKGQNTLLTCYSSFAIFLVMWLLHSPKKVSNC